MSARRPHFTGSLFAEQHEESELANSATEVVSEGAGSWSYVNIDIASPASAASAALSVSEALRVAKTQLEGISLTIIGELSDISDNPRYKAVYFTIRDRDSALPCLIWRSNLNRVATSHFNMIDDSTQDAGSGEFVQSGTTVQPGFGRGFPSDGRGFQTNRSLPGNGFSSLGLGDGKLVEVRGRFSLYAAKGRMQFEVRQIQAAGEGDLRLQVARLAAELQAQGLLDAERKLPLPAMPATIALVTSPSGKAVHDVLRTLKRRYPLARVLLFGAKVEGPQAVKQLLTALNGAQSSDAELILLVRGGGSYEDLMPFNDERLALAIANSVKPLITGIGHEPDNTIADMVASLRASTPTAAAESAVPEATDLTQQLDQLAMSLNRSLNTRLAMSQARLKSVRQRPLFLDSEQLVARHYLALEQTQVRLQSAYSAYPELVRIALVQLEMRLLATVATSLTAGQARADSMARQLHILGAKLSEPYAAAVAKARGDIHRVGPALLTGAGRRLSAAAASLESLSPVAVLRRGYSLALDKDGCVIDSVSKTAPDRELALRVQDGIINCTTNSISREKRL